MKTTNPIGRLFGRSPFGALQKHVEVVDRCAQETLPLFQALLDGDSAALAEIKEKIFVLEQEADDVKNEIRANLPRSLFMPVDRRDLLDLLTAQDSIADTVQDLAGLLLIRQMEVPNWLEEPLFPFIRRNIDAATQCSKIIHELDELLELGFRGRPGEEVEVLIDQLGEIEDETDEQGMELTRLLFEHEDELRPLDALFWFRIFDLIGDVADYAEKVGDRLRLLIAR